MLWLSSKKSKLINSAGILLLFTFIAVVFGFFKVGCIFYRITSIPCPTCFMTRALIALTKLDFYGYARYNIMALPVAVVVAGQILDIFSLKIKKLFNTYSAAVLIVNTIYYLVRLFTHFK